MKPGESIWRYLYELPNDDAAIKAIFDHFRNFGICAAVFGAAYWSRIHLWNGTLPIIGYIATAGLVSIGVFLTWLNERHGMRKFNQANFPWYVYILVIVLYGGSLLALIGALARVV